MKAGFTVLDSRSLPLSVFLHTPSGTHLLLQSSMHYCFLFLSCITFDQEIKMRLDFREAQVCAQITWEKKTTHFRGNSTPTATSSQPWPLAAMSWTCSAWALECDSLPQVLSSPHLRLCSPSLPSPPHPPQNALTGCYPSRVHILLLRNQENTIPGLC